MGAQARIEALEKENAELREELRELRKVRLFLGGILDEVEDVVERRYHWKEKP